MGTRGTSWLCSNLLHRYIFVGGGWNYYTQRDSLERSPTLVPKTETACCFFTLSHPTGVVSTSLVEISLVPTPILYPTDYRDACLWGGRPLPIDKG